MKTAIITGGSRGIGEAMTLKLGEMGYNVVINYRSDSSKALTEKVIGTLKERYGVEGFAVQADVSRYEDCEKLLKGVGKGDRQFVTVIPESLWSSVERAYNNGDYRKGYAEKALKDMGATDFVIQLQVERLGGGYYRIYHNVYTE